MKIFFDFETYYHQILVQWLMTVVWVSTGWFSFSWWCCTNLYSLVALICYWCSCVILSVELTSGVPLGL